jgi:nitrite reductase/ring-hydroxylating ferredoxin subunit
MAAASVAGRQGEARVVGWPSSPAASGRQESGPKGGPVAQSSSTAVVVALSSDVPERGRTVVEVDGTEIGVFRLGGELHAYDNYCAHAGGPVCQGMLIHRVVEVLDDDQRSLGDFYSDSELHIVCPWHGYEYDVATGEHPADPRIRLRPHRVEESGGEIVVYL